MQSSTKPVSRDISHHSKTPASFRLGTVSDADWPLPFSELEYRKEMESVQDISRTVCLMQIFAQTSDGFNASIDAFADRTVARKDSYEGQERVRGNHSY